MTNRFKLISIIINKGVVYLVLFFLCVWSLCWAQQVSYEFEDLGKPIRLNLPIDVVTNVPSIGSFAWAGLTDANRSMLIGANTENGELIEIDLTPYGKANAVLVVKYNERTLYVFAGKPGRFFKFDILKKKLFPIGEPSQAIYWVKGSFTVSPDKKMYVGTYPEGTLSILDLSTEKVEHIKRISPNAGMEYIMKPVSDVNGVVYLPMGMHHGELWSFNPLTQEKFQLLPKDLQTYGVPVLWRANDGKVYGKKGEILFACSPNNITLGKTKPKVEVNNLAVNGMRVLYLDNNGRLVLEDTSSSKRRYIKTAFEPSARRVFSLSDMHEGKLYGSSYKPGHMFSFDVNTGELQNLGLITRGGVQVYAILPYNKGLFTSSYTGGYIEYFDPSLPKSKDNPRLIANLHKMAQQERPVQLVMVGDGKIYSPTAPIKGYLGGALVQIDPVKMKAVVFKAEELIPNQSYTSIAPVPESNEILVTSAIRGGTSAVPTEKEAWVFLWDTNTEKISHKFQPIKGAKSYSETVRVADGNIYGFSGAKFFVFNPVKREVVHIGEVKISESKRSRLIVSGAVGTDGRIYAIDVVNSCLLAIDPSDNKIYTLAKHPSLKRANFAEMRADGYLYYPDGSTLMRVRVL